MKKWFVIVPGLICAFIGSAALSNYLNGGSSDTEQLTQSTPEPRSELCTQTQTVLFNQLSADGWVNADGSNFSFFCQDDGVTITGEYRIGNNYVAIRALSSNLRDTLEFRPLGTNRSGANDQDVQWTPF